jgi:DNA-binding PadR family transcriptional regulator
MNKYVTKRLFQGFICLHILHHASIEPVYGNWLIEELAEHGYKLSPGTLYPILHSLEKEALLKSFEETVGGKIRKNYEITNEGRLELEGAKAYLSELVKEIKL